MKVYIDIVFLINYFFDLILLFCVGIILRRHTNIKRILLGAFIGSLSIFFLFIRISSITLFIFKILISLLMLIISFGYKDIKYTFKNFYYLWTTSILLGGFLYLLNIEYSYKNDGIIFYNNGLSINFIVLIILSPIIIYLYLKQIKELKTKYSKYYKVDIYFMDGTIKEVIGYLDTGNNLHDPYFGYPVILLDKDIINFSYNDNNILLVPYDTLNNHGLLKCIKVDKIFILDVGLFKNVLVGISNKKISIDGVNCILNNELMEAK